jgi:transposase
MARYKQTDAGNGQGMFLSVNLKEQLLPGTLEYMLDKLIGSKIDISIFDKNYKNDKTGAKAIPPRVLIKIVIYGYSKGIKSSRGLDELCKNNIIAKALSEDMQPHWTTIAEFISGNEECFKEIFVKILTYCNELGLIGGKTFAIDGCRLPSNASIELTGTAEILEKRLKLYRRMAEKHIAKHKRKDKNGDVDEKTKRNYKKQQNKLNRQIEKISGFLEDMERKENKYGKEIKSNVTDNESALIHTSSGYIQGYIGMAVTDKENQIIMNAEAVGSANECEHLPVVMEKTLENMKEAKVKIPKKTRRILLADRNFFSEDNLRFCKELGIEAIIPDSQYKRRLGENKEKRYQAEDFIYLEKENAYECPNKKKLLYKGKSTLPGNKDGSVYQASLKDCRLCPQIKNCIRTKKKAEDIDKGRILIISKSNNEGSLCRMLRKNMDTVEYQDIYADRIQIIEPVFANITSSKELDRFMLRGKSKVNSQWQLYCMVHNLGKCLNEYNKREKVA